MNFGAKLFYLGAKENTIYWYFCIYYYGAGLCPLHGGDVRGYYFRVVLL